MHIILPILIVALVAWAAFTLAKPGHDFEIIVQDGNVDARGRVPSGKVSAIAEFFRDDLPDVHNARIFGKWQGNFLRVTFRGNLSPGNQQRIRNFLNNEL